MIYTRKPDAVVAFKIDFSTAEATWNTLKELDRMNYTLIHRFGDRYPSVRLEFDVEEFFQGDYIYTNLNEYQWHGCPAHKFEEQWEVKK